jgi:hypothetical protein
MLAALLLLFTPWQRLNQARSKHTSKSADPLHCTWINAESSGDLTDALRPSRFIRGRSDCFRRTEVGYPGSPLPARLEFVQGRISTFSERKTDPLHDKIVNFATLVEGGFAYGLVDQFRQIKARMTDMRPWLLCGLPGRAARGWPGFNELPSPVGGSDIDRPI